MRVSLLTRFSDVAWTDAFVVGSTQHNGADGPLTLALTPGGDLLEPPSCLRRFASGGLIGFEKSDIWCLIPGGDPLEPPLASSGLPPAARGFPPPTPVPPAADALGGESRFW